MVTKVGRGIILLAVFDGRTPTPIDTKISQISLAEAELSPILSQISLPWQPGRVRGKFK